MDFTAAWKMLTPWLERQKNRLLKKLLTRFADRNVKVAYSGNASIVVDAAVMVLDELGASDHD